VTAARAAEWIVDAAGDDNQEMRTAMTAADLMIVVLRPSQLDVETREEFTDVIDTAMDFNPELQVRSLITQAPTNHNETETVDVTEYIVEFPQVKPLETVLYLRKAYRDSLADGRGVIEVPGGPGKKARAEIQELVAEVYA
jgi:chromosome partitioning protein